MTVNDEGSVTNGGFIYLKTTQGEDNARTDFLNKVDVLSSQKQLHGLYMMGHGADWKQGNPPPSPAIGSDGRKIKTWRGRPVGGPDWDVSYNVIGAKLAYKLGALIIHACFSDNNDAKSLTNIPIFRGTDGVYAPLLHLIATLGAPVSNATVERIAERWGGPKPVPGWPPLEFGGKQKTKKFRDEGRFWFKD